MKTSTPQNAYCGEQNTSVLNVHHILDCHQQPTMV